MLANGVRVCAGVSLSEPDVATTTKPGISVISGAGARYAHACRTAQGAHTNQSAPSSHQRSPFRHPSSSPESAAGVHPLAVYIECLVMAPLPQPASTSHVCDERRRGQRTRTRAHAHGQRTSSETAGRVNRERRQRRSGAGEGSNGKCVQPRTAIAARVPLHKPAHEHWHSRLVAVGMDRRQSRTARPHTHTHAHARKDGTQSACLEKPATACSQKCTRKQTGRGGALRSFVFPRVCAPFLRCIELRAVERACHKQETLAHST